MSDVLSLLAAEASWAEVIEDYPYLERDDIAATLEFAAAQCGHIVITSAA